MSTPKTKSPKLEYKTRHPFYDPNGLKDSMVAYGIRKLSGMIKKPQFSVIYYHKRYFHKVQRFFQVIDTRPVSITEYRDAGLVRNVNQSTRVMFAIHYDLFKDRNYLVGELRDFMLDERNYFTSYQLLQKVLAAINDYRQYSGSERITMSEILKPYFNKTL